MASLPFLGHLAQLHRLLTHMLLTNVQLAMGLAVLEPLTVMLVLLLGPMITTVTHPPLTMVIVTMAIAIVTMAVAIVTVTMVMMAVSTMSCLPSGDWLLLSLRLRLYCPVALCWDLLALIRAVPTDACAVSLLDGVLYIGSTQDGVGQGDMVGQTTTSVIDEEVILLSGQGLPHVFLFGLLFV